MEIKVADLSDVSVIHDLMIQAFKVYTEEPSSALDETVESILTAQREGERSLIQYKDGQPVGMVRFKFIEEGLYFYRLSVIPEMQGQGIAKSMLRYLEKLANEENISKITCKVRMNVVKNINLYTSLGYSVYDEEIVNKPNGINIKVASMIKCIEQQ
ncbi:GNAT family N-acetyltransferase [Bacillus sp. PS06]|uniref:GNAT family N-acetyltransferase n=1 Tax=Bacillus sp. PS06 TaxID=2764176 RepID=UPI00177AE9F8|nr:GNAT family N-acetyltransferase [Bacillus sp. PS06]MBD8070659.1 GNAT family N-acetyltransferase [Bacillus sp. PS06]